MKKLYIEKLVRTVTILGTTATLALSDESGNESTVSGLIPDSQPFISDDLNPAAHNLFQLVKNCAAGLVTNDPEEQLLFRDMTLRDFKNGYVIGNHIGAHITLNSVDWIGDILSMGGKERPEPIIVTHFNSEGCGMTSTCVIQAIYKGAVHVGRRMSMLESFNVMLCNAVGGDTVREVIPSGLNIDEMVEKFNIQFSPDFVPNQMYTKEAAAILTAICNNTPKQEKETKVKDDKIAKLTLQEIDTNSNGDWTVKIGIDQFTRAPFSIKFIVTSRNNSDHPTRTNALAVLRQNVINSLPLTLEMEDKLTTMSNEEWHERFVFSIDKSANRGFPKNNHGAQMLGLLSFFTKVNAKPNLIEEMVGLMYNKDRTWDPEAQGAKNMSGQVSGAEVSVRMFHTLGNYFCEGNVETVKFRLLKTQSQLQVFLCYPGNNYGERPDVLNVNEPEELVKYFMLFVESEVAQK